MSQNKKGTTTSRSYDDSNKFGINGTVRRFDRILGHIEPLVAQFLLCCRSKNMPEMWFSYKSHARLCRELFVNILVGFLVPFLLFRKEKPGKYSQSTKSVRRSRLWYLRGGAQGRTGSDHMTKFPRFLFWILHSLPTYLVPVREIPQVSLSKKSLTHTRRHFEAMNVDFTVRI